MVEWKELGELCQVITGGDAPTDCIKGQQNPSETHPYPVFSNSDIVYGFSSSYQVFQDAVTISSIGNIGSVNYRPAYFTPIIRLKVVIPISNFIKTKFLYYCLKEAKFIGTSSSLSSMKAADIKKQQIPIVDIVEQERIVRILDTFTAGIENVKKQLFLRHKQYEYYRNHLLNPASLPNAEYCSIGEVCKTTSPPRKLGTKLYQQKGKYPIIDQGQSHIVGYTDDESALLPENEYVLFGDHTRIVKYYYGQFAQGADGLKILVSNRNIILPHYLFHVIKSTDIPSRGYSRHWSIVKELQIPIPTFSIQKQIVAILNQFETSIANLEQQLTLREKQYEYYRNKLLTF